MQQEEIGRRFLYHSPDEATRAIHDQWREHTIWLANRVNEEFADSREKSLIFTAMEEMSFWIHAHIARNMGDKK